MTMDTLPDWLLPTELPRYPTTKDQREIQEITFATVFERVIDGIIEGKSAKEIVETDPRYISYGRFIQWIRRDKERLKRFHEAQKCSAEVFMEESQQIADGDPNQPPEDVQRSRLRIDVRWKRIQAYDRERYGEKQSVDVNTNTTITIKNLLEKREQKLAQLEQLPIEGEFSTC